MTQEVQEFRIGYVLPEPFDYTPVEVVETPTGEGKDLPSTKRSTCYAVTGSCPFLCVAQNLMAKLCM